MFQVEDVPLVGPQLHSGWGQLHSGWGQLHSGWGQLHSVWGQVNCVGCRVSEGGWMGTGQLLAI